MELIEELKQVADFDLSNDPTILKQFSRDTSIFSRTPSVVVFPKSVSEVEKLTRFVHEAKKTGRAISLTARSAGTDMTGGPLTDSILMVFTKHMHKIKDLHETSAEVEPGVMYRDLEKVTREKYNAIFPSYPASKEYCALGGMLANNAGGELTLRYGKTNRWIESLDVVLSDGSFATFKKISFLELEEKKRSQTLEGSIYREMDSLIQHNLQEIFAARPSVSKNSSGYNIWDIRNEKEKTFDLTQVICGSQGTLGTIVSGRVKLIKPKTHHAMLVVFLSDLHVIPEIVSRVMKHDPESFESYDNHTFDLAVRFMPQMLKRLGFLGMMKLGISFMPEMWKVLTGGVPKLVLMAEFAEDTQEEALQKVAEARAELHSLPVSTTVCRNESEAEKFWIIRRESFALLRKNMHGLYAAPFIDDLVVHPKDYPEFLPRIEKLVSGRKFIFTITGHIGDGNFHIIPLVDMSDPHARADIMDLLPKTAELIKEFGGSNSGEHNDGILRTPLLKYQFSPMMLKLFEQTKKVFDPHGILNPGKKVGGSMEDVEKSMITHL